MSLYFYEHLYKISVPERLVNNLYDENKQKLSLLEPLSKINVFIGPNNSGKSLLLREIIKNSISSEYFRPDLVERINDFISEIKNKFIDEFEQFDQFNKYGQIKQLRFKATKLASNNYYISIKDFKDLLEEISEKQPFKIFFDKVAKEKEKITTYSYHSVQDEERNSSNSIGPNKINLKFREHFNELTSSLQQYRIPENFSRIYIPTIRTLRHYGQGSLFEEKTRDEYAFNENISIENGQRMYDSFLELRTSNYKNQQRSTEYEIFLSENFFDGQSISLIPNQKEKVLIIKIGNEKEQPIHNLGDGLQMLIILTFPLFNYERGIIVIEEPELFVHPGLQRKLFNIYSNHKYSKNFIFLLATHSNHFIDCVTHSASASLFSIQKLFVKDVNDNTDTYPDFQLRNLNYGDDTILDLLGVNKTSVYLSNCTIWVEGITDKLYLQKYIQAYLSNPDLKDKYKRCRNLQEGIAYSFILSAGDNIIHLNFNDKTLIKDIAKKTAVKYLCGKALVIVDDDNQKNIKRKQELQRELGLRFITLPVIEVENLLSYEIIINTLKSFPSLKDLDFKLINWFEETSYNQIRLGSFIDSNILSLFSSRKRIKRFSIPANDTNKSNLTINCKVEFCNYALPHIEFASMTKASKEVVEKILDFIFANNYY